MQKKPLKNQIHKKCKNKYTMNVIPESLDTQ